MGDTVRILGIDPGTASTGFGVVERVGTRLVPVWYDCLRTSPDQTPAARLQRIARACSDVIAQFEPAAVAIEELYVGAGARAALAVGQARGVCVLTCADAGLEVFEYAPATIKQAVCGYGRADKHQVQSMVQALLGMTAPPRPDHAADALAAAICHAGASRFARATR
jgi:crossover junction endodeoxyribonuclease RuvC